MTTLVTSLLETIVTQSCARHDPIVNGGGNLRHGAVLRDGGGSPSGLEDAHLESHQGSYDLEDAEFVSEQLSEGLQDCQTLSCWLTGD
jgi:hypothetical protein